MNKTRIFFWFGSMLLLTVGGQAASQQGAVPPGHPPIESNAGSPHTLTDQSVTGTVIETMNAANYTYVHVDTGSRSIWAAAPQFAVSVGDRVTVPTASPMQNYRSDTLNRTFPLVYFAGSIQTPARRPAPAAAGDRSAPHPSPSRASAASGISLAGIERPDGGRTVGEVFDRGSGLAGSEVAIRGRVVKYSPGIMGTNWVHLQDGTESQDGRNDLVVTTDDFASVGDLVIVRGVVATNKDFGYGYVYNVIVEAAKVEIEVK